jgi:hypothetical protein
MRLRLLGVGNSSYIPHPDAGIPKKERSIERMPGLPKRGMYGLLFDAELATKE